MAHVKKSPVKSRSPGVCMIAGRFRPNGSSAVDNTLNQGDGFSVARSGAGAFTLTITGKWTKLLALECQVWGNALTAGSVVQVVGAISLTATSSGLTVATIPIVHSLNAAGTFAAADIASNANAWLSFVAFVSDTSELS